MFDRSQSLLPKTATDIAKALDILEERLFELPVASISKDPRKVSEALLEHLAWENSVDAWGADWPLEVRQDVVQASSEVHRFKGTPYAIKFSLAAVGVTAEIVEWWQPAGSGVRGTFLLRAILDAPLSPWQLDFITGGQAVSNVHAVIRGNAPVSRGWTINAVVSAESPVFIGAFPSTHIFADASPLIPAAPALSAGRYVVVHPSTQIHADTGVSVL